MLAGARQELHSILVLLQNGVGDDVMTSARVAISDAVPGLIDAFARKYATGEEGSNVGDYVQGMVKMLEDLPDKASVDLGVMTNTYTKK
jgi:hypothetical protein